MTGRASGTSIRTEENLGGTPTRHGSDLFGREEDIAFLDAAWENRDANLTSIVAWAGVGKSTLVNHWLRRMAAENYRSAQLVFGWSFYRRDRRRYLVRKRICRCRSRLVRRSAIPRIGTAWEKGERLAKLITHRRTLLLLDGLEPLGIRRVRRKDASAILSCRRSCASLPPSTLGFA